MGIGLGERLFHGLIIPQHRAREVPETGQEARQPRPRRASCRRLDLQRSAFDGSEREYSPSLARPLRDLRLALNQDQPIGNDCFYREIEAMTGQRRELRQRGRARKRYEEASAADARQGELPL